MIIHAFAFAVSLALPPAPAADTELDALCELVESGASAAVVTALELPGARERWVKAPESLRKLCDRAAGNVEDLARKPADAKKLGALLLAMASECAEGKPDAAEPLRARACARLAGARLSLELKEAADPASFTAAADDFAAAYGKDPGKGVDLAEEARILAEAAFLEKADVPGLFERIDGLGAKALAAHAGEPLPAGRVALAMLRRGHLAHARKEKGAEHMVQKALDLIEPMEKAHPDDLDLLTARNDAAAVVRLLGLKKPKVDFVTTTCDLPNGLTLEIPRSRHWAAPTSSGTAIHQFTHDFRTLRSLAFDDYKWTTNWTLADGSVVGGDNLKGLADKNFGIEARGYKSVKSKRGLLKGKLRGCDAGYLYEIVGQDDDGEALAQRTWYWKSKAGHMTTFDVTLLAYRGNEFEDPAMDFVLDSVKEKAKK